MHGSRRQSLHDYQLIIVTVFCVENVYCICFYIRKLFFFTFKKKLGSDLHKVANFWIRSTQIRLIFSPTLKYLLDVQWVASKRVIP